MADGLFAGIDETAWLRAELKRLAQLLATERPVVHQPDLRAPFPYFGSRRRYSAMGGPSGQQALGGRLGAREAGRVRRGGGRPRGPGRLALAWAPPASPPTCPAARPIEVGQIWEGRKPRRDGSRERVRVLEVDGRAALIDSENPRPPLKARRRVGLLAAAHGGARDIGNMRLAVLADERRVVYPPGGGIRLEEDAPNG